MELWDVEGTEQSSGLPMSILCAASAQDKSYLLGLVFGSSFQERFLGRVWLWNLPKAVRSTGQGRSLVVVGLQSSQIKVMGAEGFFVPSWVIGELHIPCRPELLKKNHTIKNDLRKIQNNRLSCVITRDPERFDDFYHNMHVPFISQSHGNSVHVTPYETMKSKFPQCDLLLLNQGDQRNVAGLLILYEETGPRLWTAGIRDANPEYLRNGAMPAMYHFSFKHLVDQGFDRVSLGMSRAFLHDGVLRYKQKFAQEIVKTSPGGFFLRVQSDTPAIRSFLKHNPFAFQTGELLCGAVFIDSQMHPTAAELQRLQSEYLHPGMAKLIVFRFDSGSPGPVESLPPEFADRIVFRTIDHKDWPLTLPRSL